MNPVDWYPWGEEALSRAVSENRLLIISIGYAACHWCHVMEHESFEDPEVASEMNKYFVSVKVDREERPDVDQYYMNACQIMNGHGGWPLNVIALPDQRAVFAGTYFRKTEWLRILRFFSEQFKINPAALYEQSDELTKELKKINRPILYGREIVQERNAVSELWNDLKKELDFTHGGHRGAPKFPMPPALDFILRLAWFLDQKDAYDFVNLTLKSMAYGGIYDQVGGGFSRYSVDDSWQVPHFEKMLYDNAQLVSLYSRAFRYSGNTLYKNIVEDTFSFLENELSAGQGLFFASLDADSEGIEGQYYAWTKEEIMALFPEDYPFFCNYFGITADGNWENGRNILCISRSSDLSVNDNISAGEPEDPLIVKAKSVLLVTRRQRTPPALDRKILTAWNGMMISAFVESFKTWKRTTDLSKAEKIADFYLNSIRQNEIPGKNFDGERFRGQPFLDDLAFLVKGFLDLYQVTFREDALDAALRLTGHALKYFRDPVTEMFLLASHGQGNLQGEILELTDNVIASSNSVMAWNLHRLGHLYGREDYIHIAGEMLGKMMPNVRRSPYYFSNWASLLLDFIFPAAEVTIVGPDYREWLLDLIAEPHPGLIFSGGSGASGPETIRKKFREGVTLGFVCRNKTCSAPLKSVSEIRNYLYV